MSNDDDDDDDDDDECQRVTDGQTTVASTGLCVASYADAPQKF